MDHETKAAGNEPLILTLEMDEVSQDWFEQLKGRHFPPERNLVPAHLSLFNQLPGERLDEISADIDELCRESEPVLLRAEKLRFLGRGVAYVLSSSDLEAARERLAAGWRPWLGPQDRQRFSPHVTVQNKVPAAEARKLHEQLRVDFTPFEVRGEGLLLWRYLGGPWELVRQYPFGSASER